MITKILSKKYDDKKGENVNSKRYTCEHISLLQFLHNTEKKR